MSVTALIAYCLALLLAVATPGPAMFAVITTGVSRGTFSALTVGLGIALSDVVLVNIALAGLVAIAQSFSWLFTAMKYAGAGYLIFLGYRMWRAASGFEAPEGVQPASATRQLGLGAAIALGNPKAILFHASLMPLILNVGSLSAFDVAIIMMVVFGVNTLTMGTYAVLAGASSRWFRSAGAIRALNRTAGGAMIGTGVLIAARP
ncbi:LysE family translocator [Rhizobium sp. SEMIA 4085]|uniref:LysE family amino acid efflux protein n=1 Tax=Rhizobium gallicum bv. gallicum R602sp TaxID=1041138 RepID=A0A0B4XDM5_9HYPH|nr:MULTISPECIES: LysE family translocator [Rhizobium]AJD46084.1 LysE family amino acid efflux protein [Rhizobium gallicum bv. gallicum R602sp]NNH30504.1 LysE family translocator [Rhizobium sp. SEMIA 4085]